MCSETAVCSSDFQRRRGSETFPSNIAELLVHVSMTHMPLRPLLACYARVQLAGDHIEARERQNCATVILQLKPFRSSASIPTAAVQGSVV